MTTKTDETKAPEAEAKADAAAEKTGDEKAAPAESSLRVERRDDGCAVIWFDVPGESVNTLRSSSSGSFRFRSLAPERFVQMRPTSGLQLRSV